MEDFFFGFNFVFRSMRDFGYTAADDSFDHLDDEMLTDLS